MSAPVGDRILAFEPKKNLGRGSGQLAAGRVPTPAKTEDRRLQHVEQEAFEEMEMRVRSHARREVDRVDQLCDGLLRSLPTRVKQMTVREVLKLDGLQESDVVVSSGKEEQPPALGTGGGGRKRATLKDGETQTPVLVAMKKRRSEGNSEEEEDTGKLQPLTPLRPSEAEKMLSQQQPGALPAISVPPVEVFRSLKEADRQALLGRLGSALQILVEAHHRTSPVDQFTPG